MSRLGFAYRDKETLWYAVEVCFNGLLVYINMVDELSFRISTPARHFQFLQGGSVWKKINEQPVSQRDADRIRRERLSDFFDSYGFYPRYNQLDFNNEFAEKYAKYRNGWEEPIEIKKEIIEEKVKTGHTYGNYVYGHYNQQKKFVVDYVGRCDEGEMQSRIQHRLDKNDVHYADYEKNGTSHVLFRYAEDEKSAIEIECLLYHFYGGKARLINDIHPATTDATPCPISLCILNAK